MTTKRISRRLAALDKGRLKLGETRKRFSSRACRRNALLRVFCFQPTQILVWLLICKITRQKVYVMSHQGGSVVKSVC